MNINMSILADELHVPEQERFFEENYPLDLAHVERIEVNCKTALSVHSLYILEAERIKENLEYLSGVHLAVCGALPLETAAQMRRQYCSFIVCPDKKPAEVMNHAVDVFLRYAEWNARLLSSMLRHTSLQETMEIVAEIFHNPLELSDSSNILILTAGKIPERVENTYWKYWLPHGYFAAKDFCEQEDPEIYQTAKGQSPWWFRGNYTMFSAVLPAFGEMSVVETYEPLTAGQFSLFRYIVSFLEEYLLRQFPLASIQHSSTYILTELLQGKEVAADLIVQFLRQRKWRIDDPYYLLVVETKDMVNAQTLYDIFCDMYCRIFPLGIAVNYQNDIIIILRHTDYPYEKESLKVICKTLEKTNMYCGVSQVSFCFADIYLYYQQSLTALQFADRESSNERIFYFQDYIMDIVFQNENTQAHFRELCDPHITELRRYDAQNKTNYFETLACYFRCGCDINRAAKHLQIHRNTLSYRVGRLKDLFHIDLETADDIERLWLSCLLIKYHEMR